MEIGRDTPSTREGNGHGTPSISSGNGRGKVRLLTRQSLDGRTRARKQFDAIARGIAQDMGGEDQLSTIQRYLVEAFAGAAVHVNSLNAQLVLGEDVDLTEHSQAITTMVRIASRLPIGRVPKPVPSIEEHLRYLRDHPTPLPQEPDDSDGGT